MHVPTVASVGRTRPPGLDADDCDLSRYRSETSWLAVGENALYLVSGKHGV